MAAEGVSRHSLSRELFVSCLRYTRTGLASLPPPWGAALASTMWLIAAMISLPTRLSAACASARPKPMRTICSHTRVRQSETNQPTVHPRDKNAAGLRRGCGMSVHR